MPRKTHDLPALLGSRICHDLISPLGAIGNGLELLSMTSGGSAEMSLIAESVANANAKVRFYRVAYGAASTEQSIGRNEIVSILEDLTRGSRLTVVWNPTQPVTRTEVKLAFLMIQCFETAMPYGGEVIVSKTDTIWRIHGMATKLKINTELWDYLTSGAETVEITPAQVQFALVPLALRESGRHLTVQIRETDLLASY